MAVHVVILNEPNELAWKKVMGWDGEHYILTDRIAFVVADSLVLTEKIAAHVGMNNDGRVKGLVIEMTNRAGWNDSGLVEWFGKVS